MPSIALPVSLRGQLLSGSRFNPISLFSAGEQGIWLDPSDLTTMYQDRAGTVPVTTPGQTVGLRLDKSKGLVLGSELVTNGTFDTDTTGWDNTNVTSSGGTVVVTSGEAVITRGTARAEFFQTLTTVVGRSYKFVGSVTGKTGSANWWIGTTRNNANSLNLSGVSVGQQSGVFTATATTTFITMAVDGTAGQTVTIDNISVKELPGNHAVAPTDAARPTYGIEPKTGRRNLLLATDVMATQSRTVTAVAHTLSFTGTGTVTLTGASTAGPLVGIGANNRVSLTFTPSAASLTLTVSGSVTLAQLELGSVVTNYQRVGTAFDVTEAGVPTCHYVQYDGTDDSFATPTITPGIDKVQVFAGLRKLSNVAAILVETSANAPTNVGSFYLVSGEDVSSRYSSFSRGTINPGAAGVAKFTVSGVAPDTAVITATHDIASDLSTIRRNAVNGISATADQGTGNFLAYPIYIGRRAGTSTPFNGRDYGLIVRFGTNLDASTITATETYLASKTSEVTL